MTKTLNALAKSIATDAASAVKAGRSLVRKACAYALVYAKVNQSSLGKGMDEAQNATERVMDVFSEGYIKKAFSQARAVLAYGEFAGAPLKALALGASEEADLIREALSAMEKVNIIAAIEARIAANAGKKGGRPKAEPVTTPEPKAPDMSAGLSAPTPPAPVTALSLEAEAGEVLAQLVAMNAMESLARIAAQINAVLASAEPGKVAA